MENQVENILCGEKLEFGNTKQIFALKQMRENRLADFFRTNEVVAVRSQRPTGQVEGMGMLGV